LTARSRAAGGWHAFAWSPDSSLLYVVDDANQLEAIDVNAGRVMGAGINLPALSQVTIRPTR
jgi:hypothetical protein